MIDRLCASTSRWHELLEKIQESGGPVTKKYPKDIHVGFGDSAWTIPEDLENFQVKWFNESMYNRRDQLCGGQMRQATAWRCGGVSTWSSKVDRTSSSMAGQKGSTSTQGVPKSPGSTSTWMTGPIAL